MSPYDRLKLLADRIHLQPEDLAAIRALMKEAELNMRKLCVEEALLAASVFLAQGQLERSAGADYVKRRLQLLEIT